MGLREQNGICYNGYCHLENGDTISQSGCDQSTVCTVNDEIAHLGTCDGLDCVWGDLIDEHSDACRRLI